MNRRSLYLECSSGISGDMTVAALLDLGANEKKLLDMLGSIPVNGFRIETGRRNKCGIMAYDFDVITTHEEHVHRHLKDIEQIIAGTEANVRVKELASKMFGIVAEAESEAHGIAVEQVHFHEVGAIDSIVDILSAAFCIDDLGITDVIITSLSEGSGMVQCQHGMLPVPVPAVLNIAKTYELPLKRVAAEGEMITPTGAAIAAAVRTADQLPKTWRIVKTGIGAGKKDFPHANILRAMLIETAEAEMPHERMWMVETNIDDCSGEVLGFAAEKLLQAGARDVSFAPIYMKKGRPAYLFSVLADETAVADVEELIFLHTTSIGIRKYPVERRVLRRRIEEVQTSFGTVRVKYIERLGMTSGMPEYDSVKDICERTGLGFYTVYEQIKEEVNHAG